MIIESISDFSQPAVKLSIRVWRSETTVQSAYSNGDLHEEIKRWAELKVALYGAYFYSDLAAFILTLPRVTRVEAIEHNGRGICLTKEASDAQASGPGNNGQNPGLLPS